MSKEIRTVEIEEFKLESIPLSCTWFVVGPPGCLALDTEVMMFNGTLKKVQDVKVGDLLLGDDYTARRVLSLCRGFDRMFRVHQQREDSYVVNSKHILTIKNKSGEVIDIPIEKAIASKEQYFSYQPSPNLPPQKSVDFLEEKGFLDPSEFTLNLFKTLPKNEFSLAKLALYHMRACGFHVKMQCTNSTISFIDTSSYDVEIKIEEIGEDNFYGFELDGNHRFLLSDFTCTHNSGKCLGKDTPVIMADGKIKKVQDIRTGEQIMGDDSKPRNVLSTTKGIDNLYEIVPSKGPSYVVNEPHILCLKENEHIREISVHDLLSLDKETRENLKTYRVGVDFPFREVTFDHEQLEKGIVSDSIKYNSKMIRNDVLRRFMKEKDNRLVVPYTEDLAYLCRSLGLMIEIVNQEIHILGDGPELETSFKVVPKGKGEYFGFEIDGNHRFLLGDFTVTHNTTFLENLAYYHRHRYPVAKLFMGTPTGYSRMSEIFHPLYVYNKYDEAEENRLIDRQKALTTEGHPCPYALNFIDDVSDDPKIFKTTTFRGLFKMGSQHWAQLTAVGIQYAIDLPPDVRKSVSYVAIFREPEEVERQKLYKNFGGIAGSYADFCDLMDQLTGNFTCLIFVKRSQDNNRQKCIFYYQTKKLKDNWKFGCKEYRKWANDRYNINYREDI